MVFATLRKGNRSAFSPTHYLDPKSPEQKRREKERLKHGDLGFGLLDTGSEDDATSDDDHAKNAAAYAPLNVQELEQSIHSRLSHHSKTSGGSSGERSREAPLSQSLQQELDDDFGTLLNRHATGATSHTTTNKKGPSKWGSPVKDPSSRQLFPTLQPSTRDLLGPSSSHHQRLTIPDPSSRNLPDYSSHRNESNPPFLSSAIGLNATGSLQRHPPTNTTIGPTRVAPPPKEKSTDFPSQHSRSVPIEERKKTKAPKQATIARRRMQRNMLAHGSSEDEHSNDDSFFDDPAQWRNSRESPQRRRADSDDSDLLFGAAAPYSSPQRTSPQATTIAPTPGTNLTSKNFLALEQGDWASLMETNPLLIKSPEGKLRPTLHDPKQKKKEEAAKQTSRSLSGGSSSSEEDSVSSRNTRGTGVFSEEDLELEIYSSDDDDDEVPFSLSRLHASAVSLDVPESPEVRRQVARMTSGQLRRWDGFHLEVVALVKMALPDQVGQVSTLMKRFAGREAELIQTLQTMCRRLQSTPSAAKKQSVHHSRGLIARTGVTSPRRVSAIAGRKIDALARIAAANTLDDQTRAVKPEYVVDDGDQSFWGQHSKSGLSLNGSSVLDSEEEDSGSYSAAPNERGNRRSGYSEYDDDEDGYESYDEEEGSDYDDDNYDEGDDYEQEEEEAYSPSDDDDSSASGDQNAGQFR